MVGEHDQHEEHAQVNGRNGEEIDRDQVRNVVGQKRARYGKTLARSDSWRARGKGSFVASVGSAGPLFSLTVARASEGRSRTSDRS